MTEVDKVKRPLNTIEKEKLTRRDDYSVSCGDLVKAHETLLLFREQATMSASLGSTILLILASELLGWDLEAI